MHPCDLQNLFLKNPKPYNLSVAIANLWPATPDFVGGIIATWKRKVLNRHFRKTADTVPSRLQSPVRAGSGMTP